jgi:hypothetical protein
MAPSGSGTCGTLSRAGLEAVAEKALLLRL